MRKQKLFLLAVNSEWRKAPYIQANAERDYTASQDFQLPVQKVLQNLGNMAS